VLSLLRHRNYSLLFWSGLVSQIGSYALIAALPYYVYATSNSVAATGAAVLSEILPGVIFNTIGGVLADCLPRKLVMAAGNGLRGLIILPLLAVHGPSTLWIVYIVGFLNQSIAALAGPFGNAALPHVVRSEELVTANALFSAGSSTAVLVGSPLGGFLLQQAGLSAVVVIDGISFAAPAAAILLINVPLEDRRKQSSPGVGHVRQVVRELVLGWQYVLRNRVVAGVFLVTIMNLLATGVFSVAFAPFVRQIVHGSAVFYSWALTLQGLSGIVGALMMGWAAKLAGPRALVSRGLISLGLMALVEVLVARQTLTLAVSLLVGPPSEFIGASQNALLQARTGDAYRGRVSGAYGTTWSATLLLSTVTTTLITDQIGIRTVLIGGSLILVFAGLGAIRLLPQNLLAGKS
jgi:MFS family permease